MINCKPIQFDKQQQMNQPELVIKIIPPNPFTNSIIIAYCYIQNKSVPCQAVWTRMQPNQISLLNKSPQFHYIQGPAYKCSPLDFNNYIEVCVSCDWKGRRIQKKSKTQLVKMNRQLAQQKNRINNINCKIFNSNIIVECRMNLEINGILQLVSGIRRFNLQLARQSCYIQSQYSFKTTISLHRYQFLNFLIQANQIKNSLKESEIQQSSLNLFDFQFSNQFQRDLVLLHICQPKKHNNQTYNDINNNKVSAQKTKRSFKEIQYKNKKSQELKSYQKYQTNYGTPQNSESKYNIQNYDQDTISSPKKKVQKIKVSERLLMNNYENSLVQKSTQFQNQIDRDYIKTQKYISKTPNNQNKDFLNIFEEEAASNNEHFKTEPGSFSQIVPSTAKNNKLKDQKNVQDHDIPSINLRGSFQELQKSFDNAVQVKYHNKQSSKQIGKQKRQVLRDYSYQYPKSKVQNKNTIQRNFDSYKNSMLTELNQLKKQNSFLKKQIQILPLLTKQNNNLKKKYYQLNYEVNRLQLQKKQILADKIRYESNLNKQKLQNQHLNQQLIVLKNLIKAKQNNDVSIQTHQKNDSNYSGFYLNGTKNNYSNIGTRDGSKLTSSDGFNAYQSGSNGFIHSFRNNTLPSTYAKTYVNQNGRQFTYDRLNKQ